jgi:glycine/D-amino acid oxidase-like deaminating enzyme
MWAADWKDTSYWLDDMPQVSGVSGDLKRKVDVLIIGSGYTGLNAALEIARGGRDVMVIESGYPGYGCSTRNGGQISTHVKPSLEKLTQKVGASRASAMRQEGVNALDWIEELVNKENLDCNFLRAGRFHAAHSRGQYDGLARDAEKLTKFEKIPTEIVPKAEQHTELGTDLYYGGVVFPRHASVHPAKYHHGLLSRVSEAGATVVSYCEAKAVNKLEKGFEVRTSKGDVICQDLVVATNGYTTSITPWLRRRVIPIGSYIIATEPIEKGLMDKLFPTNRNITDTCKVVYYYRPSPDRKRILFGGRVSAKETNTATSGPKLHNDLVRVFPELSDIKVTLGLGPLPILLTNLPIRDVTTGSITLWVTVARVFRWQVI